MNWIGTGRRGALLALLVVLGACRPIMTSPEVVVTIKPVHALVAGVMEGVGEPALLMDGMVSPHTYQMRPSDARRLSGASLIFWTSPYVESTVPEMLAMLPTGARIVQMMDAPGLELLPMRESGIHGGAGEIDDPHEDHQRGDFDPHIWLDPANAIAMTEMIVAELSAADPNRETIYRQNGRAQVERLRALDREIGRLLAPIAEIPFVTFHDAFQYFERAYGLNAVATVALHADRAPGGRSVMALREFMAGHQVACLFAEPQFAPSLLETLIEGTPVRLGTLDPLGEVVPVGRGAYEGLVRGLAADLTACLIAGPQIAQ